MDPHELAAVVLLLCGSLFFVVVSINLILMMVWRYSNKPMRTTHCDEGIHDCAFCIIDGVKYERERRALLQVS
jgi:hypothetical protein